MILKGNSVGHPLPDPRRGLEMRGGINMNGNKINGISTPTSDDEVVNWGSVKNLGKARYVKAILKKDLWTESETAGFVQSITVDFMVDENKVKASPDIPETLTEKLALVEELPKVKAGYRSGNTMTFEAWEEAPAVDIPVVVEVVV